ncbi:hypothetical protein KI387_024177, partial [Taxus chinensis]
MFTFIPNSMESTELSRQRQRQRPKPKLERRNALKYVDYDPSSSSSVSSSHSAPQSPAHRYSDVVADPYAFPFSASLDNFRVQGHDSLQKIEQICRSLGLSGPDDLAITVDEFRARKSHKPSKFDEKSHLFTSIPSPISEDQISTVLRPSVVIPDSARENTSTSYGRKSKSEGDREVAVSIRSREEFIRTKPLPVAPAAAAAAAAALAPPPSMASRVTANINSVSTWDILKSFAPEEGQHEIESDNDTDDDAAAEAEAEAPESGVSAAEEEKGTDIIELQRSSLTLSSSSGDESSSNSTVYVVSAEARFKVRFQSWIKGHVLGSGSFGTVYEGISDGGFFFAVKEVSLVDQGSNAKQSISQLEQEVTLLSQFEHENIVRYLGTDKEPDKLYIFLELVTQGSLASLYQKYDLKDSQVQAYTRQILTGLKYLHERNVMHRDIKCANILVDAHGLIKLADFGLAKETSKLDELKSCKGSAYWMAPEVVNPRKTYWLPADIWSLGCTVIEMLTRRPPYGNLEWHQALWKVGHGEPPPFPSTLSRDAKDFIHQCLQVEPADRPSASELLNHPFVKRSFSADMSRAPAPTDCRFQRNLFLMIFKIPK